VIVIVIVSGLDWIGLDWIGLEHLHFDCVVQFQNDCLRVVVGFTEITLQAIPANALPNDPGLSQQALQRVTEYLSIHFASFHRLSQVCV
jgi:hypothetical protein